MEHLLIALWRASDANVESLLDTWIPVALKDPGVQACTISFADPDQDSASEGNLKFSRGFDIRQPNRWNLVG